MATPQSANFDSPVTVQGNASATPIPVTGSFTASGTQDVNLKQVGGATFALGNAAAAASLPVVSATEDIARLGIITETAPATDTASSGLNGRLQRIAQRITSLIAQIPAALGQTTMANSLSVAIASNQTAIPVTTVIPGTAATNLGKAEDAAHTTGDTGVLVLGIRNDADASLTTTDLDYSGVTVDIAGRAKMRFSSGSGTKANVSGSASSVTLLAANTSRVGAIIKNDSVAVLYVDLTGGTASATSYSEDLQAGDILEVPFGYTGLITGIWSSATGAARVTEHV